MGTRGVGWTLGGLLFVGWLFSDGEPPAPRSNAAADIRTPAPSYPYVPAPLYSAPRSPDRPVHPRGGAPDQPNLEAAATTANVNLRSAADPKASIVTTLPAGSRVVVDRREGGWSHVTVGDRSGWISSNYLERPGATPARPSLPQVSRPQPTPLVPQRAPVAARSRSGEAVRDPYVGTCDCPYDRMRNGRLCGGNSAYSKPGGRSPLCYF
jgi:uncharacterized protein YraI